MFEMHKELRKLFLKINEQEVNTIIHTLTASALGVVHSEGKGKGKLHCKC